MIEKKLRLKRSFILKNINFIIFRHFFEFNLKLFMNSFYLKSLKKMVFNMSANVVSWHVCVYICGTMWQHLVVSCDAHVACVFMLFWQCD